MEEAGNATDEDGGASAPIQGNESPGLGRPGGCPLDGRGRAHVLYGWGIEGSVGPLVVRVAPAPTGVDDRGEEQERDGPGSEAKGSGGEQALHGWTVRLIRQNILC